MSLELISHKIGFGKPDNKRRFVNAFERLLRPIMPTNG